MENRNDELTKWLLFIAARNSKERRDIADGDPLLLDVDDWINNFIASDKFKDYLKRRHEKDIIRLLNAGAPYRVICEITGLSEEDIKEFESHI